MAAYWKAAEGESVDWNNSTLIQGNAAAEITRMKAEGNRDMYVFGSADLSETFVNDNLFDEFRIGIAPVIFGSGRLLFRKTSPKELNLISTQHLSTGGAVLKYKSKESPPGLMEGTS